MFNHNTTFLLASLVMRDFKIRYRNMSLGVFWSLLNPLVMMAVLTFVFTRIFPNPSTPNVHVSFLSGLVVFNFFSLGWASGTTSMLQNASLVKKVPLPRVLIPISTVLANAIHFLIQIGLLVLLVLASGYPITRHWIWLPYVFAMELMFVCGLSLATSALDVYFRDVRYVVESVNTLMFWLIPVVYSFSMIPERFHSLYWYNPVAAVVIACRYILLDAVSPPLETILKLSVVSVASLAAGYACFRRLTHRFADYL
ncbi:MAG: ABC transporter permease [Bryobacteraceae bacterium]